MAAKRRKTRRGLPTAIGLGLAGGMRTFVPPAAIVLRDHRPDSRLLRLAIVLASAGELAADKHPSTPSRTDPVGLGGRLAASGSVGWSCAGPIGGLFAGGAAIASAFLMHSVRGDLGERTGLPDPVLGAVEDSLAFAIARAVTLKPLRLPPPPTPTATPAPAPAASPSPPGSPTSPVVPAKKAETGNPKQGRKPVKPPKGRKAAKAAKAVTAQAARSTRGSGPRRRRRRCRLCRRSRG